MSLKSYGGVHPHDMKSPTNTSAVTSIGTPPQVTIPMSLHIGAPCQPLVQVGDEVKLGQKIGDSPAAVSAPIHASVSGKVVAVEPRLTAAGAKTMSVVIENDGLDTPADTMRPAPAEDLEDPDKITALIREAGIVGMGGATFPTAFKIFSGKGKVNTVIINGAECEPYITSDHRTMLEHPKEVLGGIKLIMKACRVEESFLAIEKNKQDAIDLLNSSGAAELGIKIIPLKCQYPQGAEKQLILSMTGREVPPGGLPAAVGCAVFNVFTAYSVYRAAYEGWPAIERVVTVSGSAVNEPKNVRVRVGTPLYYVFREAGGFRGEPHKILMGGPMMGNAMFDITVPTTKGTNALLALDGREEADEPDPQCIRCGQCVSACPMKLQPIYMYIFERKTNFEMMDKYHLMDCIECGACTYICPGRLPLTQAFRTGKAKIQAKTAAEKARAEAEKARLQAEKEAKSND